MIIFACVCLSCDKNTFFCPYVCSGNSEQTNRFLVREEPAFRHLWPHRPSGSFWFLSHDNRHFWSSANKEHRSSCKHHGCGKAFYTGQKNTLYISLVWMVLFLFRGFALIVNAWTCSCSISMYFTPVGRDACRLQPTTVSWEERQDWRCWHNG